MKSKIVDNLINEIDPDVFQCHDCKRWLPIEKLNMSPMGVPHCTDCHPFDSFTLPLMRKVFPRTISQDLVSVVPVDL